MGLLKIITNWKNRQLNSDFKRIKVTSGGAFYMKSEDIFNDKAESVALIKKLNRSVENYNKSTNRNLASIK